MFLFYNSDLVVDVIKKLREGSEYVVCLVVLYVHTYVVIKNAYVVPQIMEFLTANSSNFHRASFL